MRDVPPVTWMDTRVARLGKLERRDPICVPETRATPTAVGGYTAALMMGR